MPQLERSKSSSPAAVTTNCYRCGKPGHFKDQCPLNPVIRKIDGAESEEEEKWEETTEFQDDVVVEENEEA